LETIIQTLLTENEFLSHLIQQSDSTAQFKILLRKYVEENFTFTEKQKINNLVTQQSWRLFAYRRIQLYLQDTEVAYAQLITSAGIEIADPFAQLFTQVKYNKSQVTLAFWYDMLWLMRQMKGNMRVPALLNVNRQLEMHACGTQDGVVAERLKNKERIIRKLIGKINAREFTGHAYAFEPCHTDDEKYALMQSWWNEHLFHLQFAVRSPEALNDMLDNTLDAETIRILTNAKNKGIPFFVNPYYLSLIIIDRQSPFYNSDSAIRQYVIYSEQLVNEFGQIRAWEKEDLVVAGKPNAAGWLLPFNDSIHRRYPDVAIVIPATTGRACGGLCSTCQRMYDFQRGNLNFNLQKLAPSAKWSSKLSLLMNYFRNDSALKDILITGGDALMSTDAALSEVLEAVLQMAKNKRDDNKLRPNGEKYAEIVRIRLGTRIPVYIPQRITPQLVNLLRDFRERASQEGIQQFILQMHVESAMEVTPEFVSAIDRIISTGWTLTNQMVYTSAASKRGHAVKLRHVLSNLGVLPYYTFAVKGFEENKSSYTPLSRLVQEEMEEKNAAILPAKYLKSFNWKNIGFNSMAIRVKEIMKESNLPFLATDRNLVNLPGVGKSLTYRTIGITIDGRRILEFEYDSYRRHSPIINEGSKVQMVESKSIYEYLKQMEAMSEDVDAYETIWGYTESTTEPIHPVFEYTSYDFIPTTELTNLDLHTQRALSHS